MIQAEKLLVLRVVPLSRLHHVYGAAQLQPPAGYTRAALYARTVGTDQGVLGIG